MIFCALSRNCDPLLCGKFSRKSIALKCCGNQNMINLTTKHEIAATLRIIEKYLFLRSVGVIFTMVRIKGSMIKKNLLIRLVSS